MSLAASSNGPVVLVTCFDWDSAVGVRRLYEALRARGFSAKVIHVGLSLHTRNLEETLLVQCLEYDSPTRFPLLMERELEELRCLLARLQPSLVAFSVLSADYQACLQATAIARAATEAPIVWGGIHPTFEPEQSLRDSGADGVCIGEGEEVIVDLARRAQAGCSDFSDLANMATLTAEGAYQHQAPRPLLEDLDAVPFIPLAPEDCFDIPTNRRQRAAAEAISDGRNHFTPAVIMTGFGCPYRCTFCFNEPMQQMYRGKGRYVRRKSVERTLEECRHARDLQGKHFIAFWDDIFSLDRAWLREFAAAYPREIGLPFFSYFHPQHSHVEVADLLLQAGCCSAICGVQNGSESFRRAIYHRTETNADLVRTARELNGRLDMTYDMIVDCPYETEAEWRANVELFLQFSHPFKITSNSFTYLPGCSITSRALKEGCIGPQELTWNLPGGWDQCDYLQPRRTARQHNLYILMNATQHAEFRRDELQDWMDDEALLDDPKELRLRVALRLLHKTRRLYFQEHDRRALLEASGARVEPASTPSLEPVPRGVAFSA